MSNSVESMSVDTTLGIVKETRWFLYTNYEKAATSSTLCKFNCVNEGVVSALRDDLGRLFPT